MYEHQSTALKCLAGQGNMKKKWFAEITCLFSIFLTQSPVPFFLAFCHFNSRRHFPQPIPCLGLDPALNLASSQPSFFPALQSGLAANCLHFPTPCWPFPAFFSDGALRSANQGLTVADECGRAASATRGEEERPNGETLSERPLEKKERRKQQFKATGSIRRNMSQD